MPTVVLILVVTMSFVPHGIGAEFAWQQTDRYVPPDFEGFFPDNIEGGKQLDDLLTGKAKLPGNRYPEAVRQGLRRATKFRSQILDGLGKGFIWRRTADEEPQNALAMEIMYHATGSEYFRDDALYYGLHVAKNKTNNILRTLMEFGYKKRSRTIWGIRHYDDVEHVASRLLKLLDQHEQLSPKTVLTTYDVYQGITGKAPPQQERFRDLGLFVMVVQDNLAALDGTQSLESLRTPFDQEMQLGDRLVDFTRRIHLGKVHLVALVRGAPTRDRLTKQLKKHDLYGLFSTQLLRPVSIRNLPEFQKHLPDGETLESPSWQEQVAVAEEVYAWNRTDRYVPPAFDEFFPDNAEGGLALDELAGQELAQLGVQVRNATTNEQEDSQLSDQEALAVVRRGLRHTSVRPNALLSWFCRRFIHWPQNPAAMEILYHALDADPRPTGNDSIPYTVLYYGFSPKSKKSDNVLRALYDIYLKTSQRKKRQILGVLGTEADKRFFTELILDTLEKYAEQPTLKVIAAHDGYKRLTGNTPPEPERFAEMGRFVLLFFFEEELSSDQAIQLVRDDLGPGKKLLEIVTQPLKGEPGNHVLFALIQGIAERDRLIKAFQDRDPNHIELIAVLPLAEGWTNDLTGEGLPEFRDYLE